MSWPFDTEKKVDPPNAEAGAEKKVEKTPAEIIAESVSAALKPLSDKIDAYDVRFKTLETNTKRPEPKVTPVENTSVLDDENVAFAQRLTPLMLRQLELEARIVKGDIKAEYAQAGYGELWAQYESEINQVLENSPLVNGEGKAMRGDPQYIRNAVDMIMGRAARKAGMRFDGKSKGFFLETAGNAGGNDGTHAPEADGMTEGQRKIFGRMKVPLEDAKKVMAKLKFVGNG